MAFLRQHHRLIARALENFNADYLRANRILFGGGTRIALELGEFRESVDIDFLCPDVDAYRAVRSEVSNVSLGRLVKQDFVYPKDIRPDRDAVRCFIRIEETAVKLEFVACADYPLNPSPAMPFGVPMIDRESCFAVKFLANADRCSMMPFKDIFDLLAMYDAWRNHWQPGLALAYSVYSEKTVPGGLEKALSDLIRQPEKYRETAVSQLQMDAAFCQKLIRETAPHWLAQISGKNG